MNIKGLSMSTLSLLLAQGKVSQPFWVVWGFLFIYFRSKHRALRGTHLTSRAAADGEPVRVEKLLTLGACFVLLSLFFLHLFYSLNSIFHLNVIITWR